MKEKKQKNSNAILALLAIILIILTTAFSCIGYYAWAKYMASKPGDASAQVAKWSFELRAGENKESEVKPFEITRTDGYGDVKVKSLAPGTFGEIPVFVDMTGTEVLVRLDLTFTITDCPRNIKFYSDSNKTNAVKCDQTQDDGKYVSTVSVTKYYSLDTTASNYVSQVHNETIYWDWAYETKDKNDSSSEGDELDKEDSKNDAKLKITATATQVTNIPVGKLSSKVKIGDYVDYNPGNYKIEPSELDDLSGVTLSETVRTANNDSIKVASTENVKVAALTSSTKWKVLDIDGDVVKIIPMDVTGAEVTVWGKGGYINCIEAFNRIAAIYGNGFGATGARCITVEDINKLEGYTPGTNSYVGTYSKSSYGPYVLEDENGNIYEVDDNVEIGYSPTTKTKSTNLNYEYRFNKFDKIYPKQSSFWLASRCITLYNVAVSFNIRCVAFTQRVTYTYNNYYLQSNTGAANLDTKNILPVVTLKAGILTPGKGEDGAWQLM